MEGDDTRADVFKALSDQANQLLKIAQKAMQHAQQSMQEQQRQQPPPQQSGEGMKDQVAAMRAEREEARKDAQAQSEMARKDAAAQQAMALNDAKMAKSISS